MTRTEPGKASAILAAITYVKLRVIMKLFSILHRDLGQHASFLAIKCLLSSFTVAWVFITEAGYTASFLKHWPFHERGGPDGIALLKDAFCKIPRIEHFHRWIVA